MIVCTYVHTVLVVVIQVIPEPWSNVLYGSVSDL